MERIEEFTLEGKCFIYIDFSGLTANDHFAKLTEEIKPVINKYPRNSLYTITNVKGTMFDSELKNMMGAFMKHNTPYVKNMVIIGMDGVIKAAIRSIYKISGRTNIHFAFSKEQAIAWLLQKE